MCTDIHGVFQRHDGAQWVDIESKFEQNRHYQLFAVLADVRNGRGFAGITTGERVRPIAAPRGLPHDFLMVGDAHPIADLLHMDPHRRKWHQDGEPLDVWMGDHSHSWLTADEMLRWYANAPTVVQTGILDRETYSKWDQTTPPEAYCGAISGRDVVLVNDDDLSKLARPEWTHVRCHWDAPLFTELDYFFDEVARLREVHGRVRFVFGFDS